MRTPGRVCWPALLTWLVFLVEAGYAFSGQNLPERAYAAHMRVLVLLPQAAILSGMLLALIRPFRERVWDHLENGGGAWRWGPWAAAGGMAAYLCTIRVVQYRGFQLFMDSADQMTIAWGFLHGRGFYNSLVGSSGLAIHFSPTLALWSPLLNLWEHPLVLFFSQALALASVGPAVFLLARARTGSRAAGWLAMIPAYLSPFFFDSAGASLLVQIFIFPLFLWGMVAMEAGRWAWALACALAMLGCSEQAPFITGGLGAFLAVSGTGAKDKKRFALGMALGAASVGLWFAELKLKAHLLGGADHYWGSYYTHLGLGTGEGFGCALARPWLFVKAVLWPPSNASGFGRLLFSAAFLPLLSGPALLVLLSAAAPQLLSAPGTVFHDFQLHNGAYVAGPLLWCAVLGLALLHRWRGGLLRPWLAALILLAAGQSMRGAPQVFQRDWFPNFVRHGPALARAVPARAALWTEQFFAARLALRPWIKILPYRSLGADFEKRLFLPEYVLLQKDWAITPEWGPLLSVFSREGYRKAVDFDDLLLLKHPKTPFGQEPPALLLPPEDPREVERYRAYLLSLPDFDQPEMRALVRDDERERPFAALAQGLGQATPAGAVILISGRWTNLEYCIPLLANRRRLSLDRNLDKEDRAKGLAYLRSSLGSLRRDGVPVYTLSETFSAKSMTFLLRKYGLTKEEAESLVAPYRPVKAARLKVPGLGEQTLLLMRPTDPQEAALLDKNLRRSGFAAHADRAGK